MYFRRVPYAVEENLGGMTERKKDRDSEFLLLDGINKRQTTGGSGNNRLMCPKLSGFSLKGIVPISILSV